MSSLRERVMQSLCWKKSSEHCAKRLGITVEKYQYIKDQIKAERLNDRAEKLKDKVEQQVDLDKGEAKLSGIFDHEPKSPEEIIDLLNIDTAEWKLSSYWNKQMGDHWRVSALVTRIKDQSEKYFKDLLDNWKPKTYTIPAADIDRLSANKLEVCGVMSLQDIHFGKEGNETIDKEFEDTVINLVERATMSHYISHMYFVVGGDLINMDTFDGATTKGTPLNNCASATEAYIQAFDAMHWAINFIKAHCDILTVVYIPGNHDRLSSFHLAHALSKSIDCEDIMWDIEYSERKVHVWHDNFNAFEHGDAHSKNTPIVYATEFAEEWGMTKNRTLFTGHYHSNRKVEYVTTSENTGFIHKTLPSLSNTDYYHYHNKYVGNRRSGKLELQHPHIGNICELTYSV
jgi:hypothetical protein